MKVLPTLASVEASSNPIPRNENGILKVFKRGIMTSYRLIVFPVILMALIDIPLVIT